MKTTNYNGHTVPVKKLYIACNFDCTGLPGFPSTSCFFAYTIETSSAYNLLEVLDEYRAKGLKTCNIMPTRKAAHELCDAWNETYKKNGVCAF